jgi:hypothetical protein
MVRLNSAGVDLVRKPKKKTLSELVLILAQRSNYKGIGLLRAYFVQKGLSSHLLKRLYETLHYYVLPNVSEHTILTILNEITAEDFFPTKLWRWINSWELSGSKVFDYYAKCDVSALSLATHDQNSYMWTILDRDNCHNIAHQAVLDDKLEISMLLCGTSTFCGFDGLNQGNIVGDSPAHLAARLFRLEHLKFYVNCDKVELLGKNYEGSNSLHVMFNQLLKSSMKLFRGNADILSIVKDGLARCPLLLKDVDRGGWTVLNFGIAHGVVSILSAMVTETLLSQCFGSLKDSIPSLLSSVKHAILTDRTDLLSILFIMLSRTLISRTEGFERIDYDYYSGFYTDLIIFSIEQHRINALLFFLGQPSMSLCLQSWGTTGASPLFIAVRLSGLNGLDMLRTLLRYVNACDSSIPVNIQDLSKGTSFTTWDVDNVFAAASYLGDVDSLRLLLLNAGDIKIGTTYSSRNLSARFVNNSGKFFIGTKLFSSNPIVAAIRGRADFGFQRSERNERGLAVLRYLLIQTPFSGLINTVSHRHTVSNCSTPSLTQFTTPLFEACSEGDTQAAEQIIKSGADPLFQFRCIHDNGKIFKTDVFANEEFQAICISRDKNL